MAMENHTTDVTENTRADGAWDASREDPRAFMMEIEPQCFRKGCRCRAHEDASWRGEDADDDDEGEDSEGTDVGTAAASPDIQLDDAKRDAARTTKLSLKIDDVFDGRDRVATPANSEVDNRQGGISPTDSLSTLVDIIDSMKGLTCEEQRVDKLHRVLRKRIPQLARLNELREIVSGIVLLELKP